LNRNSDFESDFKYMYLFFNLKYYPDILISEQKQKKTAIERKKLKVVGGFQEYHNS